MGGRENVVGVGIPTGEKDPTRARDDLRRVGEALRIPGGARVVGYAMAGCPSGRGIPWHRVVGAGGRLIIREPYGSLQRKLLESEGVQIEGARIDMRLLRARPRRKNRSKKSSARKIKRSRDAPASADSRGDPRIVL